MYAPTRKSLARGTASRTLGLIAALLAVIFVVSFTSLAGAARGATPAAHPQSVLARAEASAAVSGPKKAVIVVGPVGSETSDYVAGGKAIGVALSAAGVEVHLILPPHATWANVVANANGADFLAYLGHGNGWPSPYAPFQEDSKNGFGLNPTDGDTNNNDVKYYGRCFFLGGVNQSPNCTAGKNYGVGIHLAPNAVGLLNRLCYASGNGEPGMGIPTDTVAFQRADNFASTLLAAGARTVFALGWQPGVDLARALVSTHQTMEGFFESRDATNGDPKFLPYHGWVGWRPNVYFDSVRTPGARVHLDPDVYSGYLRAVTGDLDFTTDQWLGAADTGDTTAPELTGLSGTRPLNTVPADGTGLVVFTPNGDGISDVLTIRHTLSEPSYLDVSITNGSGSVVRRFTSYSAKGATNDTWNGRNNAGTLVNDGTFTITVRPKDRAGNTGQAMTMDVKVMTAMRAPKAAPILFYAADGDTLAQTQTQTVILDQPANLSWKVTRLDGTLVRTAMTAQARPVGPVSWTWNGMANSGAAVPDGLYYMVVTADTQAGTYSHRIQVRVMPFKVITSATTASAGTRINWTVITAEPQKGWPKLSIKQPGLVKYSVSLVKWTTTKFKASFTLKAGGTPGVVTATLTGTDARGGVDVRVFTITLT
jgi:flagellar hook assembly protein FlgD